MKNSNDKKPKLWPLYCFLFIVSIITSIFAIYEITLLSSIETLIRYIVIAILVLIDIILLIKLNVVKRPKRRKKHIKYIMFMLFYSLICGIIGLGINYFYGEISNINKVYITYTSDLITMSDSEYNELSQFNDLKIGILEDVTSIDGYKIPMDIVNDHSLDSRNELVDYGDYTSMIVDLYSGDIDACFVSDNYADLFSSIEGYENIDSDTRIITSKSEKVKKSETSSIETASSGKSVTEPFTILLMGIDSTDEVLEKNAVANGDTLILITFNPKTLNATMLSIPRDSYVPIACWANKPENKITHAAAYGNDCMIKTIEDYFDINIDYYAKINFKGLVKLVDSVGGVDIDVEQELCTDNSNREEVVCIYPGYQTLNGEQALVYARNRKQLANGDFGRNYHQQVLVMSLMNKIKTIKDAGTFMNILNTVSNSVDTNFTTKQILSFYNIGKDIMFKSLSSDEADIINIERLYLQGTGQMIYDERARMTLYDYVPNKNSRDDIINAMKVNLELKDYTPIKDFSFSINEEFEPEVIGYGPYNNTKSYNLLPDFTGDTQKTATGTCNKLGIRCNFVGTGGTVIKQDYPLNTRLDKIKTLTLILSENKNNKSEKVDKDKTTIKDKTPVKDKIVIEDDDEQDEKEIDNKKDLEDEKVEIDDNKTSIDNDDTSKDTEEIKGSEPDE